MSGHQWAVIANLDDGKIDGFTEQCQVESCRKIRVLTEGGPWKMLLMNCPKCGRRLTTMKDGEDTLVQCFCTYTAKILHDGTQDVLNPGGEEGP